MNNFSSGNFHLFLRLAVHRPENFGAFSAKMWLHAAPSVKKHLVEKLCTQCE